MRNQLELTAALRAIGVKGVEGYLELLGVLQPTVLMADLSAMGPPIMPPTSAMGGWQIGSVGNYSVLQITSGAKGGSFVEFLSGGQISVNHKWTVLATAPTLTGPNALTNVQLGHQSALVTGERGVLVAEPVPNGGLIPRLPANSGGHVIYLRRNHTFVLWGHATNQQVTVSCIVQDVPVEIPPDAATATLP